ncbi:hypothetical protein TNCV_3835391 [Trichonephila clavipes]|nr:hypothetical protein TNCV_3835391 [Trichonephila clavipes]
MYTLVQYPATTLKQFPTGAFEVDHQKGEGSEFTLRLEPQFEKKGVALVSEFKTVVCERRDPFGDHPLEGSKHLSLVLPPSAWGSRGRHLFLASRYILLETGKESLVMPKLNREREDVPIAAEASTRLAHVLRHPWQESPRQRHLKLVANWAVLDLASINS